MAGDPNKSMFDNLYEATYGRRRDYGSPGNNIFNEPKPSSLETKLPSWPTLPKPGTSDGASGGPVKLDPLSPLPYGQQIMRQLNPLIHRPMI